MQLETSNIEQEIRNYIIEGFLFGSTEALNEDTPLLGNVIDSQGVVELVAFLQQRFNIEVGDEEISTDNLATLKTVVALVKKNLRA